ncbi:hypothetical protein [Planotetraspora silvatica]|uniref:hypothetical protein n=1 Tax=Planotetraspora silvatica TaxID=234614 RepID=UPI0019518E9D|nr:hypothetical protein [Planotetraspora silvatica]
MHRTPAARARGITKSFGDGVAFDGVDLDVGGGLDDLAALCFEVTILATGRVVFSGPLSKLRLGTWRHLLVADLRGEDPCRPHRDPVAGGRTHRVGHRGHRVLRQGRLPGPRRGAGQRLAVVVSWHVPGATAVGNAIYQLDVTADGRYVADGDGPKEVNGYFQVRTPNGDAPNPLWQFDGNVDLLTSTTKE